MCSVSALMIATHHDPDPAVMRSGSALLIATHHVPHSHPAVMCFVSAILNPFPHS